MRSHQEDTQAFNTLFESGKFSHTRKILSGDILITLKGAIVNFLSGGLSDRNAYLPELDDGRFYVVSNIGATNNIVVRDAQGFLKTTLLPGDTALLVASDTEWMTLRGWAALAVFTNTVNGLVPAPNSVTPGSLFLRDDGQWGQVQVTGIVDAFKFITDGTNTAIGSGPDTFRLRSSSGKIGVTVTNNEAVFGDNANFTVLEAAVDHNALLNFVANKHIDHTAVTLTAGLALTGGGDISASRTFDFAPSELTTNASPVLTDFAVMDLAAGGPRRTLFSAINAILNHNTLLNYVADQHVAHSGVSIVAGSGLTGGGTIAASRTLSLDINGLTADTLATGDFFPFFDLSGTDNNKVSFATLNASIDHNALLNYVANQHIDHTSVTLTAGAGLTGGGTIAASRTFDVVGTVGITVNADDVQLDTTHVRNVDHSAVSITGTGMLAGGGTIAANRTLDLASITANTVLGSIAGGVPIALSATQLTTIPNLFTTLLKGLVPAPATVTNKFLRDDATWAAPTGSGTVTNVATTYPMSGGPITTTGTLTSVQPQNCGKLTFVSTTAIKFAPCNGDLIKINGALFQIPAAGIAGVANTSVFVNGTGASNLAASTTYFVYAFSNSGTVTADFRTDGNGHLPSDTAGNIGTEVRVSSGTTKDDTRTLIGIIRTNASSQFVDATQERFVRSWFNDAGIQAQGVFTADRALTTGTVTEIHTEIRTGFLVFAGEKILFSTTGSAANSLAAGSSIYCALDIDGTTEWTTLITQPTAFYRVIFALSRIKSGLSEGYHFVTLRGASDTGTATYRSNVADGGFMLIAQSAK